MHIYIIIIYDYYLYVVDNNPLAQIKFLLLSAAQVEITT